MRKVSWVALACLSFMLFGEALAQTTVLQAGPSTPGHAPMYNSWGQQPVVSDSGTAAGGPVGQGLSELGLTMRGQGTPPYSNAGNGPFFSNLCDYDAPITNAGGYHYLCWGPNTGGAGVLVYGASAPAATQPLNIIAPGGLYLNGSAANTIAFPVFSSGQLYGGSGAQAPIAVSAGSGILISGGAISVANASASAITSGLLAPAYGGTGVNNGSWTINLGGNLSTAGVFQAVGTFQTNGNFYTGGPVHLSGGFSTSDLYNLNFVLESDTSLTLPVAGTVATTTPSVNVITTSGDYYAVATDYVIALNRAIPAASSIYLVASPTKGQLVVVKDDSGNAQSYPLTVQGNGYLIDGSGSYTLSSNWASISLIFNGTKWNIF